MSSDPELMIPVLSMNILAVLVIAPLSWVLSEHKLHQVNVFAIRLTVSIVTCSIPV